MLSSPNPHTFDINRKETAMRYKHLITRHNSQNTPKMANNNTNTINNIVAIAYEKAENLIESVHVMAKNLYSIVYERVIMDTFTKTQAANKKDPAPMNPLPAIEKSLCMFNPNPLINSLFESVFKHVILVFHMVKRIEMAVPVWLTGEKSTNPYYFYSLLVR